MTQLCELTPATKRGARGLILPPATKLGNPGEETLLPTTVAELRRAGIHPREVALDGGFKAGPVAEAFADASPDRVFISGREEPSSPRTRRRLARYRAGQEGRISHLKRGYGLGRTRLKGEEGQRIWSGWAVFAYDLDTVAVLSG